MNPTIILWDVDGTLITAGGAGRRAIERAFESALGAPGDFSFSFAGMTDRLILRTALTLSGADATDASIDRVMEIYLQQLAAEVESTPDYRVHDGVVTSLDATVGLPHVSTGLGTGNFELGARIKLGPSKLNDYFEFGGFGCDHEDRDRLIEAGARRGAERLGRPLQECRLVIIGDTPRDASAAHANGGECLAVATGGASREDLEASGARWVLDDLADLRIRELLQL